MSEIRIRYVMQGEREFGYDGEDADAIRDAILERDDANAVPDLYDVTDTDRSRATPDEHLAVTEDGGRVLWAGWLGGVRKPAPGTAGDGQQADLGDLFLEWLGEEFEIVADASYEESDLKHAFIAGHGAAVQATPADIPLRLARCPEHPGKVHAQAGSAGEWACLRGLADTAEAGVPGQGDQQGDLVTDNEELGEALTGARAEIMRLHGVVREALTNMAGLDPEETARWLHDNDVPGLDDQDGSE